MLKSLTLAAGLWAASAAITAAPAAAEDLQFTLINLSGGDIVAFHVSPIESDMWEENLLAGGYLPNGNEIDVIIADGWSYCAYDILTEWDDGSSYEDYDLDLCDLGSYTFQ